ncbi:ead/Ea22-like family protein [Yersinia enterocolitica]
MNNLEELKKVAMKATQGEWVAFSNIKTGTFAVHTPHDKRCNDIVDWMGFDGAAGSKTQRSHNAKFIAAANPSVVLALIAQLEAAQKELFDLHNQEFQQRLANAEHQLYMKDLAIHNIKASRKAQFRKRLAAEAELSAANEKLSKAVLPPRVEGILKQWQFERDCEWIESIKAAGFTVEGE